MAQVTILLSTYNGSAYLEPLLNSLVSQSFPDIQIRVRDDGSTDNTREILGKFASDKKNVRCSAGPNLGVFNSFMTLLREADGSADYFAFCDQDDIWLTEKMSTAVEKINSLGAAGDAPCMYCSRVILTNSHGGVLSESRMPRHINFPSALVENIAHGCTVVMNRAARSILVSKIPDSVKLFHDWWCYLVVSVFGRVIFDPNPHVLYRRHRGTVSYGVSPGLGRLKGRLLRLKNGSFDLISTQAEQLLNCFGDQMPPHSRRLTEHLVAIKSMPFCKRLLHALINPCRRQRLSDDVLLRAMFLLGRY
ncbi:MAG: glycosyltransferase [Chitinispirillaceae bacterium]|jgi:glycosyltransferase involved in cell wall biosynthesis|nr:glycosyltransferase [Chitinispirillaceae bacterium]